MSLGRRDRLKGSELEMWERWEDSEVARPENVEGSEVSRWEFPGFIQG